MALEAFLLPFMIGFVIAWALTSNPLVSLVGGALAVLLSAGALSFGLDWTKAFSLVSSIFGQGGG